jgi:hypothetical protein
MSDSECERGGDCGINGVPALPQNFRANLRRDFVLGDDDPFRRVSRNRRGAGEVLNNEEARRPYQQPRQQCAHESELTATVAKHDKNPRQPCLVRARPTSYRKEFRAHETRLQSETFELPFAHGW